MMKDGVRGAATMFYAQNHEQYSADDIAKGMLFHNYGAENRGFATLRNASYKYVSDTNVALQLLEERAQELNIFLQ